MRRVPPTARRRTPLWPLRSGTRHTPLNLPPQFANNAAATTTTGVMMPPEQTRCFFTHADCRRGWADQKAAPIEHLVRRRTVSRSDRPGPPAGPASQERIGFCRFGGFPIPGSGDLLRPTGDDPYAGFLPLQVRACAGRSTARPHTAGAAPPTADPPPDSGIRPPDDNPKGWPRLSRFKKEHAGPGGGNQAAGLCHDGQVPPRSRSTSCRPSQIGSGTAAVHDPAARLFRMLRSRPCGPSGPSSGGHGAGTTDVVWRMSWSCPGIPRAPPSPSPGRRPCNLRSNLVGLRFLVRVD